MMNQGFGAGGFTPGGFGGMADNGEMAAMARQYWSQWGEMLRAGGQSTPAPGFGAGSFPGAFPGAGLGFPGGNAPAGTGLPGWNEAVTWWSQLASGGTPQADATVQRFNAQAQGWYSQIQQLAAQFAGQEASAGDVAKAWKEMFGGHAGNPFADALQGMHGQGMQGFDQWMQQVSPSLEKMRQDSIAWTGTPTFGLTREHEQRWKELAHAHSDYQRHTQAYQSLMNEALQDAFKRFEKKLGECSQPGNQLESMRALFDLWIDSAEESYAEIAQSPRFRDAYGELGNAQMKLRSAVQKQVEQAGDSMGVPTRTEVDAAHRKITQLERELRQLRTQMESIAARDATPAPARAPAKVAGEEPAAEKVAPAKPAAKPAAARKPASKTGEPSAAESKKTAVATKSEKTAKTPAVKKTAAKPAEKKAASAPAAKKSTAAKKQAKKTTAPKSAPRVTKSTKKGR